MKPLILLIGATLPTSPIALGAPLSLPFHRQDTAESTQRTSKSDRLARDVAGLEAALAKREGDPLHATMLEIVSSALEKPGKRAFAPSRVGGVKRKEIAFIHDWNTPQANRDGAVPAADYANPNALPAFLQQYARDLDALGIELLVVPIPLRIQVYPEHLVGIDKQADFEGYGAGLTPTLLDLARNDVEVLDLLPGFCSRRSGDFPEADEHLYLDYDLHWTPRGVSLAADSIAERIERMEWFEQGPHREGTDFVTRREAGDWLVVNNQKLDVTAAKKPARVWFERVLTESGENAHRKDQDSPIVLIGDSFSGIYNGKGSDIASLLYARLGHRIDTITLAGGGTSVWQSLARRGESGLKGKRVVIWVASVLDFNRKHRYCPLIKR